MILGGGLSGVAAAYELARSGSVDVTILEQGSALGGLAGSFEREGYFYPLGYHHILKRDRVLLRFLGLIGALDRVRWRRIRMLFRVGGESYDLASPFDFWRFPMSAADKMRFALLMLRAFGKRDWSDWEGRSARELIDTWAGPGVREALFEPLTRLKFDLPCEAASGAWLGARLHYREGSSPLGYIPGANWTKVLCDGVTELVRAAGVEIRLKATVVATERTNGQMTAVELANGSRLSADVFVSTVPTEIYCKLAPDDSTAHLTGIRYSALVSAVCASQRSVSRDFYWMNLASLDRSAGGVFILSSLNPTIGEPGASCVNFVTHLQSRHESLFTLSDEELLDLYLADFLAVFGFDLDPTWANVSKVPMYSPVFTRDYRNPPLRSSTYPNVYFAGNYRTFPSIASTGTALGSGVETAAAILEDGPV